MRPLTASTAVDAATPWSSVVSRLRRRTSTGFYLAEIDGLRFFCIMPVVLYHLEIQVAASRGAQGSWLHLLLDKGGFGVQFFFMISGFILSVPFVRAYQARRPRPSLRTYYLRRLTRLEPPYVLSLLVIGGLWMHANGGIGPNLGHLVAGIFYLHAAIYHTGNPLDTILWSLEVEIQFYLVLPLLATVFAIRQPWVRRTVLIVPALYYSWGRNVFPPFSWEGFSLVAWLGYFLLGMVLAELFVAVWEERPTHGAGWRWNVVGLGAPILLAVCLYNNDSVRGLPYGLLKLAVPLSAFLVFLAAFRSFALRRVLTWTPLAIIGGMCYSIYLLHQAVIERLFPVFERALTSIHSYPLSLVAFGVPIVTAVLAVSVVYFVLVERPCMTPHWPSLLVASLRRGGGEVTDDESPVLASSVE